MNMHRAIYNPATGEVYGLELSTLGAIVSQRYLCTIEKRLTAEQALAAIIAMGPMQFFGIKTEEMEEDAPESWERDPEWWKE